MKISLNTMITLGLLMGLNQTLWASSENSLMDSHTPTPTATATITPTAIPTATATVTPTPTSTPIPTVVEAPGQVFYKMPTGEIVSRETTLVVPLKGQGDVSLKTATRALKATKFWTTHLSGRTIFNVAFENPPGAPANTFVVFSGSYLRGSNVAVYYGDIYQRNSNGGKPIDLSTLDQWSSEQPKDLTYSGGFFFKAPVK